MLPITHLNKPGSRVAMWMGDGGIQSYLSNPGCLGTSRMYAPVHHGTSTYKLHEQNNESTVHVYAIYFAGVFFS